MKANATIVKIAKGMSIATDILGYFGGGIVGMAIGCAVFLFAKDKLNEGIDKWVESYRD